jgi:plasmid stabilization system protein ParE
MKPVRLLLPAEEEMINAAQYYESQAKGLGVDFLDKIDSALREIGENPERWPVIGHSIRRRLVHRFPYGLLYRIEKEGVLVLAITHLHRRPNYWIHRI